VQVRVRQAQRAEKDENARTGDLLSTLLP